MSNFAKDISAEEIFKELGKPDIKKDKFFESMKDVYMLAFLLGIKNNERLGIKKKSADPIKDEIFGEENKIIMDFIALYLTKDINILKKSVETEEEIHTMVEEYTNGGIYILSDLLKEQSDNLDHLISVVKEFEVNSNGIKKVDIADLLFEVNQKL